MGDVAKACGEAWKAMDEKEKAPYEKKAAADKVSFQSGFCG